MRTLHFSVNIRNSRFRAQVALNEVFEMMSVFSVSYFESYGGEREFLINSLTCFVGEGMLLYERVSLKFR